MFEHVPGLIEALLRGHGPDDGVLPCGWLPREVDTLAMDNGGTAKEGVGRTHAGVDGYCPLAAYLGAYGPRAPILARRDSGSDCAALMRAIDAYNQPALPRVDWLIKWNPRSSDASAVLARLDAHALASWHTPRAGKRVAIWDEPAQVEGIERPVRRVWRLTERRIDRRGQQLLVPEVELEGWSTSLSAAQFGAQAISALYAEHGTHEQVHAEFKTDLSAAVALGQIRHPRPGAPTRCAGDEPAAADGPARPARPRRAGAPRGQAPTHQDGDTGAHLPSRPLDRQWPAPDQGGWASMTAVRPCSCGCTRSSRPRRSAAAARPAPTRLSSTRLRPRPPVACPAQCATGSIRRNRAPATAAAPSPAATASPR
jgi:hypothetical protein